MANRTELKSYSLGIDIGGTFTDFVLFNQETAEVSLLKISSHPRDPLSAVLRGISELMISKGFDPERLDNIVHGTTMGINAVIERNGPKTGLLVTKGFKDILELRRLRLPNPTDFYDDKPEPLVTRNNVKEIDERILANGKIYRDLDIQEVNQKVKELVESGIESLAICFLHSYKNSAHEEKAKRLVEELFPDLYVSVSSEIWPQQREYERTLVTVINAYLARKVGHYFSTLQKELIRLGIRSRVFCAKSNGGMMTAKNAGETPVETLFSGPAMGVIGAHFLADLVDQTKIIAFDMGGTSADVSVFDEVIPYSNESSAGEFPIIIPSVEISSIGAGGGSIAWTDSTGVLKVGPSSAGADPGPACYGKGGTRPTVTDAYLCVGILNPNNFLGGRIVLDETLAKKSMDELGSVLKLDTYRTAQSILAVATSNMYAQFAPLMAQKGVDTEDFCLFAYGGAGPVHSFLLAKEVGIRNIIIPFTPGTLCALGCLVADLRNDFIETIHSPFDNINGNTLEAQYKSLEKRARDWLQEQGIESRSLIYRTADMRYLGQSFEILVDVPQGLSEEKTFTRILSSFHSKYESVYGFSDENAPIEIINIRSSIVGITSKPSIKPEESCSLSCEKPNISIRRVFYENKFLNAEVYQRVQLNAGFQFSGPAIVEQYDSTIFVPPGYTIRIDQYKNIKGELVTNDNR